MAARHKILVAIKNKKWCLVKFYTKGYTADYINNITGTSFLCVLHKAFPRTWPPTTGCLIDVFCCKYSRQYIFLLAMVTKLVAAWSTVNELFFNYCMLLCLTSMWLQSTVQLSLTFFLEIITFPALLTVLEDCPFPRRHADWLFWFYSLKAFCNKNVHPPTEFTVVSCGTWVVHYNKHTHPWKKMPLNSSTDTQLLCPRYVTLTLH